MRKIDDKLDRQKMTGRFFRAFGGVVPAVGMAWCAGTARATTFAP